MKTYTIQTLRDVWHDGKHSQQWELVESFQDKELAMKELENLKRQWILSGTFRFVES